MMQRHGRTADFFDERFALRLEFFQIGRAEGRVGRARENQIRNLEIANGTIVRSGESVDFFRDAQGSFADLVGWTDVADDGGVDVVTENDHHVIPYFPAIGAARESARKHDVRIGRADEKAKFL